MALLTFNLSVILETFIFGIVASSVGTIVVELCKKRRKRYHISVTMDSCEVYASQEKSAVKIWVDYKGKAVDNALVVLYLSITNDGHNDIMFRAHFLDTITVKCDGYQFLSFTTQESKVNPKGVLNEDGTASLSWDILKVGEQIRLCIAAHSMLPMKDGVDGAECFNDLSFDFRSDCIDNLVPSREMTQREIHRKRLFNFRLSTSVLLIIAYLGLLLFDMSFSSRFNIIYDGQSHENATLLYSPLFQKYILDSDTARTKVLSRTDAEKITSILPADHVGAANLISAVLEVMILLTVLGYIISIVINRLTYSNLKNRGVLKGQGRK